ncbi:MAG: preprotein translocase subunit SecY [Oscillospiraceae bacterium]|nr:preprotein translocase subunit SecY [Oscillospiraceae bacterium]
MIQVFRNAIKVPELRMKLIYTMIIIVLYRLGANIPVPFIDTAIWQQLFSSQGDTIFGYLNILSGDAFSKATLFALSITPYITASIVMQLLTIAIPALEKLQKSGDDGRKKITQITRYVTVVLGIITGYGYYMTCRGYGVVTNRSFFAGLVIVVCYSAGSALIMWLGEKINENGIGNGISLILFANIISRLPVWFSGMVKDMIDIITGNGTAASVLFQLFKTVVIIAVALVIVAFVVFMSYSERRIPVQYSKRMVGRKMYGGQNTYLPIKVNMSGVMPIIFASSMVSIPATIIRFISGGNTTPTGVLGVIYGIFKTSSPVYIIIEFALIIAFSYFYIAISFNPIEVSNNLKKNGGFIPGIRPGLPTTQYITKILNKIVLIGGIFLGVVAVTPLIANAFATMFSLGLGAIAFGGSSLLIVVGVAIETTREIEAQMTMRHYKGFLE